MGGRPPLQTQPDGFLLAEVKVLKARQVAATSILASVFTCQNVFVLGLNMLSSV